ncbi:MAG: hypothetical protein R3222_03370 [Balneolaceae bacterium]|nr:hypothetical protein [Balneolaceae bacterium]
MLKIFKNLLSTDAKPGEDINIPSVIDRIKKKETVKEIPLGRRIHTLHYGDLDLFLDRDITENYRVTVYRGRERIYSFSIFADQGDYETLKEGFENIIEFLNGGSKVNELPDNAKIKGFFYGN